MNKRDELKSNIFKAQVKRLKEEGLSVSKITKELGRSYTHTKNIFDRIE